MRNLAIVRMTHEIGSSFESDCHTMPVAFRVTLQVIFKVTFLTLSVFGNRFGLSLGKTLRRTAIVLAAFPLMQTGNASAALSCSQAPLDYVCTAFDIPGAASSRANGISNNGKISGYYEIPGTSVFRWSGSGFDLPSVPSGASAAYGFGVNDAGHLVGYSLGTNGFQGFLWNGSAYSSIAYPGASHTFAFGINATGAVAGAYQTSPASVSGFLLTGSNYETVNAPNARATYLYGVNDAGVVAGTYIGDTGDVAGFTKDGAAFTDIRVPGAMQTYVRGINGIGDVVGNYIDSLGATRGFAKLSDGAFWTFSVSGALRTHVMGINDSRAVAGYYTPNDYFSGGFVANLKPLPLPSAVLLLAGGLIILGRALRRKRLQPE